MFRGLSRRRRAFCMVVAVVGLLVIAATVAVGCRTSEKPAPQREASMKGYELYSWKDGGAWHFAVLEGTNRIKTLEEIKHSDIDGVDRVEARLRALPQGAQLLWTTRDIQGLSMPPSEIVKQVKDFCSENGIALTVD